MSKEDDEARRKAAEELIKATDLKRELDRVARANQVDAERVRKATEEFDRKNRKK